jgi:GNAT superfamily N-acetyltransferase
MKHYAEVVGKGDWLDIDVELCDYEDIKGTEMFEESLESKIDHPNTHVGDGDIWFKVQNKGFSGLWQPANRTKHLRFAPCFVREEYRGEGVGKAMVIRRFDFCRKHPYTHTVDTYAHNPGLFKELGFEQRDHWESKGTYYLYKDFDW